MKNLTKALIWMLVTSLIASAETPNGSPAGSNPPESQKQHWAYRPILRPDTPAVRGTSWVRTPIDAFILARLLDKKIQPSPDADRAAFIRRATLDVWGIVPTPEEVRAFVADRSPQAYEKLVDRLLASPKYGERWGRHWLDLARYADSDGYNGDATRPGMWRYRDYVIQSFNQDKPYDQFVREQIAGDELWPDSTEAFIATGFMRNYPDEINARDLNLRRQEIMNDITDTVGSVFLATTVGCAKCHDHKFDPISQADYYSLQSFFANVSPVDDRTALSGDKLADYLQRLDLWKEKTQNIRARMDELASPVVEKRQEERIDGFVPGTRAVLRKDPGERDAYERWIYHRSRWTMIGIAQGSPGTLKDDDKKKYEQLRDELKKFDELLPKESPYAQGMAELQAEAPPTYVLQTGVYDKRLDQVQPRLLPAIAGNVAVPEITPTVQSSGRRTALANWLVNPQNPLTARVIVNRVWFYYFGRGIVESVSDFGVMGRKPSNPELLDWLASELVNNGWSLKKLQREILLSSVYRQSSAYREQAASIDPSNKLLWRFPRTRLDAEEIRDSVLSAAGLLESKSGGPGVFPPVPDNLGAGRAWTVSPDSKDQNRRSVYVFVRRNIPYPLLDAFDMASPQQVCSRRESTTTAPQALTLINSDLVYQWSQSLASRVIKETAHNPEARLGRLYQILLARLPDEWEAQTARTFLDTQGKVIAQRLAAGKAIGVPSGYSEAEGLDRAHAAAFVDLCHALINSNEFVYRF